MGSRHAARRENDAVRVICRFRLEVVVQSCYLVERRNFQPESPGYHMDIFESRDNDLSDTPQPHTSLHHASRVDQLFGPPSAPLIRVGRRRWMLQTGLTGAAGLSLPAVLQTRAQAAERRIQICEQLPLQAEMMDKFAIIRSMDAGASNHTPITFQAANPKAQRTEIGRQGGGYPSMGSVAAQHKRLLISTMNRTKFATVTVVIRWGRRHSCRDGWLRQVSHLSR